MYSYDNPFNSNFMPKAQALLLRYYYAKSINLRGAVLFKMIYLKNKHNTTI